MKSKLSIKDSKIFMVAAVLVIGTISMIIPTTSFAQPYDQQQYEDQYADPYAKENKKSSSVNIQKIKCINENTNINGIDITEIPQNDIAAAEAQALEDGTTNPNGNGLLNGDGINFDKNLVNICVNVNLNEQIKVTDGNEIDTCEDCFREFLSEEQIEEFISLFDSGIFATLDQVCLNLDLGQYSEEEVRSTLEQVLGAGQDERINNLIECLLEVGIVFAPEP